MKFTQPLTQNKSYQTHMTWLMHMIWSNHFFFTLYHMNLLGLSLPDNLHLYDSNVPLELGYLLIEQIHKQYTS